MAIASHTEFDFAVIGGGLVGAAIAWGLARRGRSVAMLDEGDRRGRTGACRVSTVRSHRQFGRTHRLGPRAPHRTYGLERTCLAMNMLLPVALHAASGFFRIVQRTLGALNCIPYWPIALSARVFSAAGFWQSGQTKVAGWHLKPGAIALFQNDYQLPLIDPTVAAYVSAFNEHLCPILLVLGLATRFAALVLLLMTAVIEIFVYPGAWPTHGV